MVGAAQKATYVADDIQSIAYPKPVKIVLIMMKALSVFIEAPPLTYPQAGPIARRTKKHWPTAPMKMHFFTPKSEFPQQVCSSSETIYFMRAVVSTPPSAMLEYSTI